MNHPDFRVRGKIFATLGYPKNGWGAVMITPKQQAALVRSAPDVFAPAAGKWGLRGATTILLQRADRVTVKDALFNAWCKTAPKTLVRQTVGS